MQTGYVIYSAILFFMEYILPGLLTVSVVCGVLLSVRKEQYRKQISLEPSPEERKIRELVANGAIQQDDAERLLDKCNVLPEIREDAPEPDLPLKLASVISQIYAQLKIVFLLCFAVCFCIFPFIKDSIPNFSVTLPETWKIAVLSFLIFAMLILSVMEFFAAKKLCRGSFGARNFLIAMWLIDFAMANFIFAEHSVLYLFLAVACGLYCFFVLVFRKDAVSKLTFRHKDPVFWKKCVIGILVFTALVCGFMENSSIFSIMLTQHVNSFSITSCLRMPQLKGILLIQGSPEPETLNLMKLVAGQLTKALDLPCRIQAFREVSDLEDRNLNLPILFTKGTLADPGFMSFLSSLKKKDRTMDAALLKALSKMTMKNGAAEVVLKMKNPFIFDFRSLNINEFRSDFYKGLNLPPLGIHFKGVCAVSAGSSKKSLNGAAEKIAKQIIAAVEQAREYPTVRLPDVEMKYTPLKGLDLSGLKNPRLFYRSCGVGHREGNEVYRFERTDYKKDVRTISEALARLGYARSECWDKDYLLFTKNGNRFRGDRILVYLCDPEKKDFYLDLSLNSNYGLLIHESSSPEGTTQDKAFIERFRKADLRSFVLSKGLSCLKGDSLIRTFDAFSALKNLSYNDKMYVLQNLWKTEREALQDRFTDFFCSMVDEAFEFRNHPEFVKRAGNLFSALQSSGFPVKERQYLMRRLGPMCVTVRMPSGKPERGNVIDVSGTHKVSEIGNSVLFLNIEFEKRYPPLVNLYAVVPLGAGKYRIHCNEMTISGYRLSDLDLSSNGSVWLPPESFNRGQWNCNESRTGVFYELPIKSGQLTVHLIPDVKENKYRFRIKFWPK